METFSVAHRSLQMFCSDFWPGQEDCQLILDEIGMASGRINMSEPSIMRWLSIIRELIRKNDGSMGKLVVVLVKQYPDNKDLRAVCAPWLLAMPVTAAIPTVAETKEPPLPEIMTVVAPVDFADEAALVVPRLETLWQTVIEQALRMAEQEKRLTDLDAWARAYPFGKLAVPRKRDAK